MFKHGSKNRSSERNKDIVLLPPRSENRASMPDRYDRYHLPAQKEMGGDMSIQNICFIGAGHVGAPTATVLAYFNPTLHVTVVDKDHALIQRWNSGHLPLVDERGLDYLVRVTRDGTCASHICDPDERQTVERPARKPNLVFSTDMQTGVRGAGMVFLCVDTPTAGDGVTADTAALEAAVKSVAEWGKEGFVLVIKSTVPVGMASRVREMVATIRPEVSFEVLSNPEFMAEGEAVVNLIRPDRVLIGSSSQSPGQIAASALAKIYRSWVTAEKMQLMSSESAELAKLTSNAMLAQRISSINSISALCGKTGADIHQVSRAVGSDPRIGPHFLQAGIGFGGSCFKKDILNLAGLADSHKLPGVGEYWRQVLQVNDFQSNHFVSGAISKLKMPLSDKKIAIFGWSFKKNTKDTRESSSLAVYRHLLTHSVSNIDVFDPGCDVRLVQKELDAIRQSPTGQSIYSATTAKAHDNPYSACKDADAILLLTDWDYFRGPHQPCNQPSVTTSPRSDGDNILGSSSSSSPQKQRDPSYPYPSSREDQNSPPKSRTTDCATDCNECHHTPSSSLPLNGENNRIDWSRVSDAMKSDTRWIFDGRNLFLPHDDNRAGMERLGFRVGAIWRKE